MKKTLTILAILWVAINAEAQDIYSVGYYNVTNGTIAALYKNNQRVYTAHYTNYTSKAIKIVCNTQRDMFWMVNHYNSTGNTLIFTEIRKNNQVYASTEGHDEIHISDMYMLNDTLYCAGYQLDENGITIATVWKGEDFTPHWVLGDSIHASIIYDADVDKNTNIPYFCGYVSDTLKKACVWEASQLLYKQEPEGVQRDSWAKEISIDNSEIYTNGYLNYYTGYETVSIPTIWKDNVRIDYASDLDFLDCLYAQQGDLYYTLYYPHGMYYAVYKNRGEFLQLPLNQTGVRRICGDLDDIYMVGTLQGQGCIWKNFEVFSQYNNCDMIMDIVAVDPTTFLFNGAEWYYEILNDNGSITYQHLECAADTTINGERPKIIIRSNTQYDKDLHTEVTHEYIYEENGVVYWWNKTLEEFTVLYNLVAEVGDEWEIKVGTENIIVHVDDVDAFEYDGETFKRLYISDANNIFDGEIVVGFGHMTSFFPERLMTRGKGYRVDGLRCYWVEDALLYHNGEEDCDAIYSELHDVDENGPSIGSGTFTVYPNPANNVLFVETCHGAFLQNLTCCITNPLGQTILSGHISAENQQIDIETLPTGMYFISIGEQTVKFVKQ